MIKTEFGKISHKKPVSYQFINGKRIGIDVCFKKIDTDTYGFDIGNYNRNRELVIDPVILVYSTFLGGSNYDQPFGFAIDNSGAVYIVGETNSPDFPMINAIRDTIPTDDYDGFVTKISPDGQELVYSTYMGGEYLEHSTEICVDDTGCAYVIGFTGSSDFPLVNPFQGTIAGQVDGYVTKLSPDGTTIIFSTLLGGQYGDYPEDIVVDSNHAVYVVGSTQSRDFPVVNALQSSIGDRYTDQYGDAFVTKFASSGDSLVFSTYLGGRGTDYGYRIALTDNAEIYVSGETDSYDFPIYNAFQGARTDSYMEIFVSKLSANGASFIYSTYLGGSGDDYVRDMELDGSDSVYIVGKAGSSNFPIQNALPFDGGGIITKFSPDGSFLEFSTFYGGNPTYCCGIAIDSSGYVYVSGTTASTALPVVDAFQDSLRDSNYDVFVTKFSSDFSNIVFSTYIGGYGNDGNIGIRVSGNGDVFICGNSPNFPTKNAIQPYPDINDTDMYIAKLGMGTPASLTITSPPSNDVLYVGSTHEITWTSTGSIDNVRLEYMGEYPPFQAIVASTPNDGSYNWTVTIPPFAWYEIRILDATGNIVYDSVSPVAVSTQPMITVTSPNGDELWLAGSQQNITWTTIDVTGNVKIEYSSNNGGNWSEIAADTENDGIHSWTVPDDFSSECLVRISETDGSPTDTSDALFSIVFPPSIPTEQRSVLIALYNSTDGDNWTNNSGWKNPPLYSDGFSMPGTETDWHGITVSGTSEYSITNIGLWSNNLSGSIPSELGNLNDLVYLYLDDNQLTGSIPASLGNLSSLKLLYLDNNQLSGSIPPELGNLTQLEWLYLHYNQLSGNIPAQLGNLSNLKYLSLHENQLSGSIPIELGNLGNLLQLNLSHNQLNGSIPAEFGNLGTLNYLNLSANQLSANIPPSWAICQICKRLPLETTIWMETFPVKLEISNWNFLIWEITN